MPLTRLSETLANLAPGEVEILSEDQFEMAFTEPDLEAAKRAAVELGESYQCSVLFTGNPQTYVAFTKR